MKRQDSPRISKIDFEWLSWHFLTKPRFFSEYLSYLGRRRWSLFSQKAKNSKNTIFWVWNVAFSSIFCLLWAKMTTYSKLWGVPGVRKIQKKGLLSKNRESFSIEQLKCHDHGQRNAPRGRPICSEIYIVFLGKKSFLLDPLVSFWCLIKIKKRKNCMFLLQIEVLFAILSPL